MCVVGRAVFLNFGLPPPPPLPPAYSLVMKWRFTDRIQEQMNAFMKVGLCSSLIRWSLTAMLWPVPGVW